MASVLITGGAGFIGFHLQRKLQTKHEVASFDLFTTEASRMRKSLLPNIQLGNIHQDFIQDLQVKPDILIHLAAETGIAGSMANPAKYFQTNVAGTFNVLEQCAKNGVKYLIYASSSSVYSPNQTEMLEDGDTSHQLSFYGTTKKISEEMIKNYCAQFGITAVGLRFFTVYGSYTRPDMAAYKFMQAIDSGEPVTLYNYGSVFRDFTHVSDIVHSLDLVIANLGKLQVGSHSIFNIGFGAPVHVADYAACIARQLGKTLHIQNKPLPANELASTHSNTDKLYEFIHYKPLCDLETGVEEMTNWFKRNRYA